ncbi:polysaccharide pyruvyl transferase family protein [Candidatus Saccharibacteria bacterium]|nr:polysaccharide pyruvyl transferase family protein [Candidatus Saccharibacteria bacterium]
MKKIGCITYHASHNYGSCLQAYALQEFVKRNFDCSYEIINLRTENQSRLYSLCFDKKGLKNIIKSFLYYRFKKQLVNKYDKFESFINERIDLSPTSFSSFDELNAFKFDYDCCISGSDQIWNTSPADFDWSYYLGFIDNCIKASYAASFGPIDQKWDDSVRIRVASLLKGYDRISVREEGSRDIVKGLLKTEPSVNIDPTMLLSKGEWDKIINKKRYQEGDYIFLYDLKNKKDTYRIVKYISKAVGLPVVVAQENLNTVSSNFIKRFDAGPEDFLNLIKNAKLVISSSFHGSVFPIIFGVPFFAIDGGSDYRINNLLRTLSLEHRSINSEDYAKKIDNAFSVDYTKALIVLSDEKKNSRDFLSAVIHGA